MSETMLPPVHLTHSTSIGALAAALAKAQSVTESAPKNHTAEVTMKSGGKYRYSYADLAGVWDAGRGPLSSNGLSVVQAPTLTPAGLSMTTLLMHSSGEWCRGELKDFPVPDRTPQGVGTAITYARRYTFGAMVGIVSEEDDDGGNGGRPKTRPAEADSRDEAPRSTSAGPTTLPNYGPAKGAPIRDAPPHVLDKYLEDARKELADPSKTKFHGKASALIRALEAELKRQGGAAPGLTPMDKIRALAKDLSIPGTRVAEWLQGNGLKDRESVTETFVAAFRKWAKEWTIAQAKPDATSTPAMGRRTLRLLEPSEGELDAMRHEENPPPPGVDDAPF